MSKLAPSSLRGILRGGVRHYLEQLVERTAAEPPDLGTAPTPRHPTRLIEDLASGVLPMRQAAARLRLVLRHDLPPGSLERLLDALGSP